MEKMGDSMAGILEAIENLKKAQDRYVKENPEAVAEWRKREAQKEKDEKLGVYRAFKVPIELAKEIVFDSPSPLPIERELFGRMACGKRIVAMCGMLGTGKTLASCRWLAGEWDGLYIKAFEYFALSDHMDSDRPKIDEVKNVDSLVVDELSMSLEKDQHKLEALLHHRIDYGKKTVVIVDKSPGETMKHLGERISSRIWEDGAVISAKNIVRKGEIKRQAAKK